MRGGSEGRRPVRHRRRNQAYFEPGAGGLSLDRPLSHRSSLQQPCAAQQQGPPQAAVNVAAPRRRAAAADRAADASYAAALLLPAARSVARALAYAGARASLMR
jgi:hypothetical protein